MSTVVVVDAWKECEQEDIDRFPFLSTETKLFGNYMNICLMHLRQKHTIVHCADGREIMDEIDTSNDIVVNDVKDITTKGPYFFCGFHLGRCIDRKIKELDKKSYIILNLSALFPADKKIKIDKNLNYCYYSYAGGLERISIK